MKHAALIDQIDAILLDVADRQIITAFRYGGPDEVRGKIHAVREKLEAMKTALNEKGEGKNV